MDLQQTVRGMLLALILAVTPSTARAALITFTHESIGSGSIGGEFFGPAEIVITAYGDTDDRQYVGWADAWFIDHASASIWIDGVGEFDFLTATKTFVNNDVGGVGFGHAGENGPDLLDGPLDPVFTTWEMLTSIGPIEGEGWFIQWDEAPVETTSGMLLFDEAAAPVIFTAIVVPAPGVLGIFAMAGLGRRRRGRGMRR